MTRIPADATVTVNVRSMQNAVRNISTLLRHTGQIGQCCNNLDILAERFEQMYWEEQVEQEAERARSTATED